MWRRSFLWSLSLAGGVVPLVAAASSDESRAPGGEEVAERWKRFAAAACLQIPERDVEQIAPSLERLKAGVRRALQADLGFIEPLVFFRFPGGVW